MAAGRAGGTTIVRISIVLLSIQADKNIKTLHKIFEKNLKITFADSNKKQNLLSLISAVKKFRRNSSKIIKLN
jgi:hypothetical protein